MTLAQPVDAVVPADETYVSNAMRITIAIFIIVPLLAVIAAIPVAWGGFIGWSDVFIVVLFWAITAGGITIGFHRYFTHGSFKTNRFMKYVLGIAGSLALQGSLSQWVADHRKHHQFSDEQGDPHSPWRFGTSKRAIAKGLYWSHVGWLFSEEQTDPAKYAPDIANDPDVQRISRAFPLIVTISMLAPAVLGGLLTWSWLGALTGFFWGSLIRIALVHHVTWSINSICHVFGNRPFNSRDLSSNVWWLAIPAMGESWHSLHHAEPTAARHGVFKGQMDISAAIIRGLEKTGLATDVRWPKHERLVRKLNDPSQEHRLRKFHPARAN
ncbi:MAG: acyl-CoA desaturase [Actinomycetes bacterium]